MNRNPIVCICVVLTWGTLFQAAAGSDCDTVLKERTGIDVTSVNFRKELSKELRNSLVKDDSEDSGLSESAGGSAGLTIKNVPINLAGSSESSSWQSTLSHLRKDEEYILDEDEVRELLVTRANSDAINAWRYCIKKMHGRDDIQIESETGESTTNVVFNATFIPQLEGTMAAPLLSLQVTGGKMLSRTHKLNEDVPRGGVVIAVVKPDGLDEVRLTIRIGKFTATESCESPTAIKDRKAKEVAERMNEEKLRKAAANAKDAEKKAVEEAKRKANEARLKAPKANGNNRSHGLLLGEDRGSKTTFIPKRNERISSIQAQRDDTMIFQMRFRGSEGSAKTAGNGGKGSSKTVTLDDDEYIVTIEAEFGDYMDWIEFTTSKRRTLRLGGRPSEDRVVSDTAPAGRKIIGFQVWSGI